jgi:hypothetical protein
MAIAGDYNTGKSFSRRSIKKGENVFVIAPNSKSTHLQTSDGSPIKRLNFIKKKGDTIINVEEASKLMKTNDLNKIFTTALGQADSGEVIEFTGNYVSTDLDNIGTYLQLIDRYMPQITVVIISDFTHYISKIISDKAFISRKAGGEAFQRFWELAGSALQNVIIKIDSLMRENLVVIKEYHTEYNEAKEEWTLYVPGGKMLQQAFMLPSYYDYLLFTHVEVKEDKPVTAESYKFVTERWGKYPARFQQLFEGKLIPNNLQMVLEAVEKDKGIKLF